MFEPERVKEWMLDCDSQFTVARSAIAHYENELGFGALREAISDEEMAPEEILSRMSDFFTLEKFRAMMERERVTFTSGSVHVSPFSPIEGAYFTGMVVLQTKRAISLVMAIDPHDLAIKKRRKPGKLGTIGFSGTLSLTKILKGTRLTVRPWTVEPCDDACDLVANPPKAEALPEVHYREGESFWRNPTEETEFLAADGPVLLVQSQMLTGPMPVSLEYDVDTLKLLKAAAVSPEPTRLQMLSTITRLFDRQDGFETVSALLEYPQHFVRWHAMRELLALDSERALPLLLAMMESDPQPSVRRAAQATVATFFPDALDKAA